MAYKILTKRGIENTNIDGARENFFNSGMRDGIVKGAFNEGKFSSNSSNSIYLDSCELRIAGHRVVIDEPVYKTFSNIPSKDTRYSLIAQISVSESADVEFSLFVQSVETVLIKDNLYATGTGQGTYQVEIGRFTLTDKGTVEDVVKTIDNITGTTESIAGGINIGNVTTKKIDYKFNAEVDVTQRYDSEQKKTFTDFNFQIPTQYPIDLDKVEEDVEDAKSKATEAVNTANNANSKAEELEIQKADRTELFSGSYNDLTDKPTIVNPEDFATRQELEEKADLTNASQTITAHDIKLQGFSMFDYCAGLNTNKAEKDASNIDISSWIAKLLTGEINYGDKIVEKKLSTIVSSVESSTWNYKNYIKFASGLIIQWGVHYPQIDNGDYQSGSISFGLPFTNTNGYSYAIFLQGRRTSEAGYRSTVFTPRNATNTKCDYMWYGQSLNQDRWKVQWLAIGY